MITGWIVRLSTTTFIKCWLLKIYPSSVRKCPFFGYLIPFWECFSSFGVLVGCWFWSYATQEMHAVSLERIAWWMEAYQDRCTEKTEETPANGHEYSIGYHHSQLSRRVGWNGCRPKSGWEINVSCCVCFFQFGGEEKEPSKPIFHLELCVFSPRGWIVRSDFFIRTRCVVCSPLENFVRLVKLEKHPSNGIKET